MSSPGLEIVKRLQLRARVLRNGLAVDLRREKFLAARISIALREELSGIGSDAARLEGGA